LRQQKYLRRDERSDAPGQSQTGNDAAQSPTGNDAAQAQKWDKLFDALTHSGFRALQARRALERIRGGDGPIPWSSPIDELLRAALQVLT
jgi:hypothetical protein